MWFRFDEGSGSGCCSVCVLVLRIARYGSSLALPVMCEHVRGWHQATPMPFLYVGHLAAG